MHSSSVNRSTIAVLVALLAMLAPFTLDTYLPSFPDISRDLLATDAQMQRTLSDYLLAFGLMMLIYGPLSDALGRKRVVLVALLGYSLASAACAMAQSIEGLIWMRAAQGMAAGAGMVIGRAVVRDLFSGPNAQQVMARVMLVFAIAPAVAPIVGGWLDALAGWRAVFWFLSALGFVLLLLVLWLLPETLHAEHRQSIHPGSISRAYVSMLMHRQFLSLVMLFGINFGGLFLYIAAAPHLMYDLLGYGVADFWRLFIPAVSGIVLGSQLSGYVAHKWSARKSVWVGMGLMSLAAVINVLQAWWLQEAMHPIWVIAPVALYAMGMSLAMTPIGLLAMDLFPHRKGMVSALQGFAQTTSNAFIAAFVVTLLLGSVLNLAYGMFVISVLGWLFWWLYYQANV
ncbi:MAG: multidrug effflux MFS transporter [Thiotrichales bacterium]|nr:multidrug effflux MFS transporter [Thiotrichales bacterium]